MNRMDVAGKRILILGLAREGVSLARALVQRGAQVTVTDAAQRDVLLSRLHALQGLDIPSHFGRAHTDLVHDTDILFVSPGAPESNPVYLAARQAGIPVESMTTLFFDECRARIIGVTGSSGKTTTTGLIGHIVRAAGRDVVVGGNIGDPMLDLLPHINDHTLVVLELSSFQLTLLRQSPWCSVVTNISPNHLDRHITMDEYVAAKQHIAAYQNRGDSIVLNANDDLARLFAAASAAQPHWFGLSHDHDNGSVCRDDQLGLIESGVFHAVIDVGDVPLLGRHNLENVLAATAVAGVLGIPGDQIAEAIRSFTPAKHRLQLVLEREGVRFVDDSIATSPARAAVALEAITGDVLLIAGGRDKHAPWDVLAALIVQRVRAVYLIGEAKETIAEALQKASCASGKVVQAGYVTFCPSLEDAVHRARSRAIPGDTILLSPACASYDMFADFEARGDAFARAAEADCAA